jgi:hypothetical protein
VPGAVLTNAGNTIAGAGMIGLGDNNLTLINSGTIDATAKNLQIATGGNTITNARTLEASGSGILLLESNVVSSPVRSAMPAVQPWPPALASRSISSAALRSSAER